MNTLIKKDPEMAENKLVDNNRITELIQISSFFKIVRLILIIFNLTIILASFEHIYYVFVDRVKQDQFENLSEQELMHVNSNTFITYYSFNNKDDMTRYITMIYYTFTTLATVGFGDYHPIADEEKMLACFVFLSGVSVISYLMGIFGEILRKF